MLWLLLSGLTLLAAASIVLPFIRPAKPSSGPEGAVYLAQLKEIDREESLGFVTADDANLARLEINRRLAKPGVPGPQLEEGEVMRRSDQITLIGTIGLLAVGSALLYVVVGSPAIHSSERSKPSGAFRAMPGEASSPPSSRMEGPQNRVAPVDELLVRLEDRLSANPDDVEGWRMLGWSRFRMGDVEGARQAYARAVQLDDTDPDTLSAYGEVLARLGGGTVTDETASVLEKVLALNPGDPRARFLLGLKKEQDGDPEAALDDWIALLASSSPGDEWRPNVQERILELADKMGVDVSNRLPTDISAPQAGPTAEDVAAAAQMSETERQTMIEGMVARLDQKLQENPDDLDGWIRLIRSRKVLGQEDQIPSTLKRAKAAFQGNETALKALDAAASAKAPD